MQEKKIFDYAEAVAELEKIAATVEDPATPLEDIDSHLRRASELVRQCQAWLRGVRERTLELDAEK
ncbi:MAG: exodeoxyribonuclease VII small subunit [Candidatus Cryptobacteroides sp.]